MRRLMLVTVAAALVLGGCSTAAEPQDVTVGLTDYAFAGLPEELAAGSTLTVDNQSDEELHELVAILLPDDEDRTADELVQLPPQELAAFFGGVRAVLLQPPGSDQVIMAEGGPPEGVQGGPPHVVNGMWTELTVTN